MVGLCWGLIGGGWERFGVCWLFADGDLLGADTEGVLVGLDLRVWVVSQFMFVWGPGGVGPEGRGAGPGAAEGDTWAGGGAWDGARGGPWGRGTKLGICCLAFIVFN